LKLLSRIISAVLVLCALGILVFGPRANQSIPADRRGDVVVEYWEKWVGPEADGIQQIVSDFNDTVGRQKHIYVQCMSMSNITQKTLTAIAGGMPPDVAGLWHDVVLQFAALDAVEPLEKMAADHGITADSYKPVYWNACHYNGHLYALVSTPGAVALFYNTRLFHENADKLRRAGLDPDRPPRTLEELDRYAAALNTFVVDSHGRRHLDQAGYLPMEPGWYITNTPIWFGTDVWEGNAGRFVFTDPRVVRACQWIQGYSLRLGAEAVNEFTSQSDIKGGFATPQNAFIAGKVVMEQQGPWMANYIHHLRPQMDHDWAAAPFPSAVAQQDVTFCPFDALMIPKGAKHKREAFEFIAYVNRQDVMEKLCKLHCKNSPLARVSDDFLHHHPNPYIGVFEELARSPNAHGPIQCPIAQEAGSQFQAAIQGLVSAGRAMQPAEAMALLEQDMQAKWESYLQEQRIRREKQ